MYRPINETEDLILSITKNCETLIEQTHRKAEETLEFKLTKPREALNFNPLISIKESQMIGLTSLEVYKFSFSITVENNKFEPFKIPDWRSGGVSYEKVGDEIKGDLEFTDITVTDIQDERIGSIIIEEYREQV